MALQSPGSPLQSLKGWSMSPDGPRADAVRPQQLCWGPAALPGVWHSGTMNFRMHLTGPHACLWAHWCCWSCLPFCCWHPALGQTASPRCSPVPCWKGAQNLHILPNDLPPRGALSWFGAGFMTTFSNSSHFFTAPQPWRDLQEGDYLQEH